MHDFLLLFGIIFEQFLIVSSDNGLFELFLIFKNKSTQYHQVFELVHPDLVVDMLSLFQTANQPYLLEGFLCQIYLSHIVGLCHYVQVLYPKVLGFLHLIFKLFQGYTFRFFLKVKYPKVFELFECIIYKVLFIINFLCS